MIRLRLRCRTRVEARICEFVPVTRKQGKGYTTWYSPVYQYTVNMQEYRIKSVAELKAEKLPELGIHAVIYVDGENPEQFIGREEDGEYSGNASSSAAIGISFFLLPYLGLFLVVPLVFVVQPLIDLIYFRVFGRVSFLE